MNYKLNGYCEISDRALDAQAHLGDARDELAVYSQLDQQMDKRQDTAYELMRQALKETDSRTKDIKIKAALQYFTQAEQLEADESARVSTASRKVVDAPESIAGILSISERERMKQPAIA